MICVLELDRESPNTELQPKGWILASHIDDARRQAEAAGDMGLAKKLYMKYEPHRGKYLIDPDKNIWMLVS